MRLNYGVIGLGNHFYTDRKGSIGKEHIFHIALDENCDFLLMLMATASIEIAYLLCDYFHKGGIARLPTINSRFFAFILGMFRRILDSIAQLIYNLDLRTTSSDIEAENCGNRRPNFQDRKRSIEEFCEENSYLNIAYRIILRYYQIYIVIQ